MDQSVMQGKFAYQIFRVQALLCRCQTINSKSTWSRFGSKHIFWQNLLGVDLRLHHTKIYTIYPSY